MGWIIALIIIILIASSGSKNGNSGSANNAKGGRSFPNIQKKIDRFEALMREKSRTQETQAQIDEVVDALIDDYLYFFSKYLNEVQECAAIAGAFSRHPSCIYHGKKYPPYRGQSVDDIIYDLINDPRYIHTR